MIWLTSICCSQFNTHKKNYKELNNGLNTNQIITIFEVQTNFTNIYCVLDITTSNINLKKANLDNL